MKESPKLEPVDLELFFYLFHLSSRAMVGAVPLDFLASMVGKTIEVNIEGEQQKITFQNHPIVRMMEAVASAVEDDEARISVAGRIFHTYNWLNTNENSGGSGSFQRLGDSGMEVHPAVVTVASHYPATVEDGFNPGFLTEVTRVRKQMDDVYVRLGTT